MIAPWVEEEMSTVKLGDVRLDARAAVLLSSLGEHPNLSIPAGCRGRAEMAAAYRFFDNDKVTFDKVLAPHIERTLQRAAQEKIVLLVQDTSEMDLTRPNSVVAGTGTLDNKSRRGFLLHEMQAFTTQSVPLGTAWATTVNRPEGVTPTSAQTRNERQQTPIEEKESFRWLEGMRAAREVAQRLAGVSCICIGDSESDIYEVFAEPRGEQSVHWLIRACQNRALTKSVAADGDHEGDQGASSAEAQEQTRRLRERVLTKPVLYKMTLAVRGRKAKTGVEKRGRRQSRENRQAEVEVRSARVTLRAPRRPDRVLPAVTVNVVMVSEPNPPPGEPKIEWILVTTLPIDTPEQVRLIVEYYCVRWSIEILFRTLKSGCRIEERRFEDIERVLPCLGVMLIVAWRTLFVCRMGRSCPDIDCEAIFEPCEWQAVWVAVHGKKAPKKAPKLAEMVHLIAQLGGYVERPKHEPGVQTLWIGMQRMYDLAWAWNTFGPGGKIESS
jgi:hypothetical protein